MPFHKVIAIDSYTQLLLTEPLCARLCRKHLACFPFLDLHNNHSREGNDYHRFIDKGTEARRGVVTCPRALSPEEMQCGLKAQVSDTGAPTLNC